MGKPRLRAGNSRYDLAAGIAAGRRSDIAIFYAMARLANDVRLAPGRVSRARLRGAREKAAGGLGSVGIHREFITAATRWIMEAKL